MKAKRAQARGLAVVLFVICLALPAFAATQYVVIRPVANVYSQASLDADVVSQAIYGVTVTALDEKEGWARIQTPDSYQGWTQAADLKKVESPYAASGRVAHVIGLSANVYRETSVTKHAPVITVPFETRLEVLSEKPVEGERWLQVRLPDGRTAWVQMGDVTLEPKKLSIAEAIELAKKFIGVTYTWGGTSSFGYDCSGFMQMLMRQRGILMPRDADDQAAWSGVVPVKREELQPGDLLYFGSSDKRITHTGMYIGNGQFIHDTTSGHPSVQISDLNEPKWSKLLVAARRAK